MMQGIGICRSQQDSVSALLHSLVHQVNLTGNVSFVINSAKINRFIQFFCSFCYTIYYFLPVSTMIIFQNNIYLLIAFRIGNTGIVHHSGLCLLPAAPVASAPRSFLPSSPLAWA